MRIIDPYRIEVTKQLKERVKHYKGSYQAIAVVAGVTREAVRRIFKELKRRDYYVQIPTAEWMNKALDDLEGKE